MSNQLKIKNSTFIASLTSIVILYLSGTTLISLSAGSSIRSVAMSVLFLLLFYCSIKVMGYKTKNNNIVACCIFVIIFFVFSFINYSTTAIELIRLLVLFFLLYCFCLYANYTKFSIWNFLYKIIVILSIISLLLYLPINVFEFELPHNDYPVGHLMFKTYFGFYSTCSLYHINKFGLTFYRLQSIFWEPGAYGMALDYSIYYLLFVKKKVKKYEIIILFTCLLLTLSTTGICLGVGLFAIYWYKSLKSIAFKSIMIVPIILVASSIILKIWMDKVMEENMVVNSYYTRMSDVTVSLEVLKNHPFFGTGYRNELDFKNLQGFGRSSSNGLLTWFYTMGLFGAVLVLYPFIANIIKEKNNLLKNLCIVIVFIVTNMSEPLIETPFMLLIVANMYVKLLHNNKESHSLLNTN